MSKKFILNDREVVFNEDVEQNDDWRSRDLFRWLEAVLRGSQASSPGVAGTVDGGAIIGGLDLTKNLANLSVEISPGAALMAFGGLDPAVTNGFQVCSSEDAVTLNLPVAPVGSYRWDLIEVTAAQNVTTEVREVLSVGVTPTLSPTPVNKVQDNALSFRIRSGPTSSTREAAMMPDLDLDDSWLPTHAILVEPSALAAGPLTVVNLKKMLSRAQPESWVVNGFDYSPHMYSEGFPIKTLRGTRSWVTLGGYRAPLQPPIEADFFQKLTVDPNRDVAAGLSFTFGQFYYVYAYRPSSRSGFTSVFISDIPPVSVSTGTPGSPSAPLTLPRPFPGTLSGAYAHYVCAVKVYQVGSDYRIRPFRQHSGYAATTGFNLVGGFAGLGNATSLFINTYPPSPTPAFTTGVTIQDFIGLVGERIVPEHVRTVRADFSFANTGANNATVNILTFDDFIVWEGQVLVGHTTNCVVDIPVTPGPTQQFKINVVTAASQVDVFANALGYYEDSA